MKMTYRFRLFASASCILFFAMVQTSCKKEMNATVTATVAGDALATVQSGIVSIPDPYWDSVFTRYGGGWTGGDAAYSYGLPDGRSLWLWGDCFIDTVYPDRTRPVRSFVHNSMVTTDVKGGNFTTYYNGSKESPEAYFNVKRGNDYYWPTNVFMNAQQTKIFVMMIRINTPAGGGFEIKSTDVAVLDYPSLALLTIRRFSTGDYIDWSSASLEDDDGYVYLYGAESMPANKYIHIARTKASNPFKKVEYYDGANWVTDSTKSARVQGSVSQTFSVFKYNSKYYLLSQGRLLSDEIYIWDAAGPAGPFSNRRLVYKTPKLTNSTWTYNATAHTELSENGELLVGYCTNTTNIGQLYNNADTYRPYFIKVTGWQ